MSISLPDQVENLIESLRMLPGVGRKTAARLAFFLLRNPEDIRIKLGHSILSATEGLRKCQLCGHFSSNELCEICADEKRDHTMICIIEDSLDLLAVEKTGAYSGTYHVLGGALAPLDGIGPEDLRIPELVRRIESEGVRELIIATNPTLEGEATAALIQRKTAPFAGIRLTRLARGIPVGGDVEYADEITLARSLENRVVF